MGGRKTRIFFLASGCEKRGKKGKRRLTSLLTKLAATKEGGERGRYQIYIADIKGEGIDNTPAPYTVFKGGEGRLGRDFLFAMEKKKALPW